VKEYDQLLELFQQHLEKYKAHLSRQSPAELYQPCNYILSLGGKRVRPLLALVACDLFGRDPKLSLDAALAVELFHNFSLIHDDILDKAPLRRNKPTVHIKWNTDIAILSGDAMLVEAQKVLESYSPAKYKTLSSLFNSTATKVCEGQQLDMNYETSPAVDTKDYIHMISYKTAVLLGCSLQMGAQCAGGGKRNQELIYEFGKNLGIAFQLMDDYLDAFAGDQKKFGKQKGGDIIANKKTFLLLKAFELADKKQKQELKKLLQTTNATKKVNAVLQLFRELKADQAIVKEAERYTALAVSSLNSIKAPAAKKEKLKRFALELIARES
jgi:geranylgeranyl diphosphate synthase type II